MQEVTDAEGQLRTRVRGGDAENPIQDFDFFQVVVLLTQTPPQLHVERCLHSLSAEIEAPVRPQGCEVVPVDDQGHSPLFVGNAQGVAFPCSKPMFFRTDVNVDSQIAPASLLP